MNKTGNTLDNCILMDLKVIEKDLELFLLLWTAVFAIGLSWATLVLALPIGACLFVCLYNLFKKLYGQSVFGSDALFFRTLPIPPAVFVTGKIFTGGFVFLAMGLSYYICKVFRALINGDGLQSVRMAWEGWIYGLVDGGIPQSLAPVAAALEVFNLAVGCFTVASMILAMMLCYYQLMGNAKSRMVSNTGLYVGSFVIVTYLLAPWYIKEAEMITSVLLVSVLRLAVGLILLAGCWKVSVVIMKKKEGGTGDEKK